MDSSTSRRSPIGGVIGEVRLRGCKKERDDNKLAVEGFDGVEKVQIKENPGERAAAVWRWRCRRGGAGGKVGQGVQVHWSSLLTPRAVPCRWFTVRDGKSGRLCECVRAQPAGSRQRPWTAVR